MRQEELVIEAGRSERHYWVDLWRYRELLYFLSWRDVLVRYKQTGLGVAWALLRPLLQIVVLTAVFHHFAKLDAPGKAPYVLLVCAAQLPWQFFANALSESSNSLLSGASIVTKVYFPRLIVPASAVIVALMDFLISFAILVGIMAWYRIVPTWRFLALPPLALLTLAAALGGGLWLAALTVKYRDFRYVVPFLVQFGLYVSPVGFDSSVVPPRWKLVYSLNPMVGVIDGFRWAVLGGVSTVSMSSVMLSLALVGCLVGSGVWYFRRTERSFADVI
jgi:homopolymeric O-antigen transport system permease protein